MRIVNHRARMAAALCVAALMLLAAGGVAAQTSSTTPQVTPVVVPPPPPAPSGPSLGVDAVGYPFDFHFAGHIFGYGFKSGERVTVTIRNVSALPAAIRAGPDGRFSTALAFTWVFCGPNASTQPSPVVVASGDEGSQAQYNFPRATCPMLVSAEVFGKGAPTSALHPAAHSVPAGAVTGHPSVSGPEPAGGTPVASGSDTFPPRLAQFDLQGFGFVPGEHVSVQENFGSLTTPSPVTALADNQGRLHFSLQAYVPGHCSTGPVPLVLASGDQGTAVAAPLSWRDPIMSPCPVVSPGRSTTARASAVASQPIAASLHPSSGHPGATERLHVRAEGASGVSLTVTYAGGSTAHRSATVPSSGYTTVRWVVPSSGSSGVAHIELTVEPGHFVLPFTFTVR